jgi:hypothetical protein
MHHHVLSHSTEENSQNMNCIASKSPLTWMHDRQSSYDEIQLNTRKHFHNFRHLRMAFHPVHCLFKQNILVMGLSINQTKLSRMNCFRLTKISCVSYRPRAGGERETAEDVISCECGPTNKVRQMNNLIQLNVIVVLRDIKIFHKSYYRWTDFLN